MATSNINPVAPTDFSYVNNTKSNDMTDKNVFFKILSAELSNQDPMSGKDGTEYVSQLAQFTALEQTQQLYTAVNRLLMSQSVTEAGMMIGKEVQFAVRDTDGSYKTEKGIVSSVTIESGQVYLHTKDNKKYALEQSIGFAEVEEVKDPEKPSNPEEGDKVDGSGDVENSDNENQGSEGTGEADGSSK